MDNGDQNNVGTPNARDNVDYEKLLMIDSALDEFLDANRRRAMSELLQGVVDLVQLHGAYKSVWVQYAGPRTFDGQMPQ